MRERPNASLEPFLRFLYDPEGRSTCEIKEVLRDSGVNLKRLDGALNLLLQKAEKADSPPWLVRAKQKRAALIDRFKIESVRIQKKFSDSRELMQAVLNGEFGSEIQNNAQVFFRNQAPEKLSERDLTSFLEDCELLALLDHKVPDPHL